MNSEETVSAVLHQINRAYQKEQDILHLERERIVSDALDRIRGVGRDQYEQDGMQKFETMPLDDLMLYVEEEALDLINYGAFVAIRVRRLRDILALGQQRMLRGEM